MRLLTLLLNDSMELLHRLTIDICGLLAQKILKLCQVDFSLNINFKDEVDSILSQLSLVLDKGVIVNLNKF